MPVLDFLRDLILGILRGLREYSGLISVFLLAGATLLAKFRIPVPVEFSEKGRKRTGTALQEIGVLWFALAPLDGFIQLSLSEKKDGSLGLLAIVGFVVGGAIFLFLGHRIEHGA